MGPLVCTGYCLGQKKVISFAYKELETSYEEAWPNVELCKLNFISFPYKVHALKNNGRKNIISGSLTDGL